MTTKPDPLIGVIAAKIEAIGATLNVDPTIVGRSVLQQVSKTNITLHVLLEALDEETVQRAIKDLIDTNRIEPTVDEHGELKYQAKKS